MNRHMRTVLLLPTLLATVVFAGEQDDRDAVEATVQGLFQAMAQRDVAAAAALLLPEGRLIIVSRDDSGVRTRAWDHGDFIAGLEGDGPTLLERYWDVRIDVDGDIAAFRARYDFHRDGVFSHCGVDLFDLVRSADGWRIAGGTFTRVVDDCGDSPLPAP